MLAEGKTICSYRHFLPEEHKNSGWHQKDFVAGDELQDVLLIGGKFVQEISDKHQAVGAHRL